MPVELVLVGIAVAAVGLPLAAIVAFVMLRAKSRESKLAEPWGRLAEEWGGQFAGKRITCRRDDHHLTVEMVLVSVVQATRSPYYPDGGTFTKIRLAIDPNGSARISDSPAAQVDATELSEMVPAFESLPADVRVILGPTEAVVVLPGAETHTGRLSKVAGALAAVEQYARENGPFAVRDMS